MLLVREREMRRTRPGSDYMRLTLADRTAVVPAVVWDDVEEAAATAAAGDPVRVIGTSSQHTRYGPSSPSRAFSRRSVDWERRVDSPVELAQALRHIILSHHGCIEHGSPVIPVTREALLVHTMDKLSGDLGSVDRLERETPDDEPWSRYDRALGRSIHLPQRASS